VRETLAPSLWRCSFSKAARARARRCSAKEKEERKRPKKKAKEGLLRLFISISIFQSIIFVSHVFLLLIRTHTNVFILFSAAVVVAVVLFVGWKIGGGTKGKARHIHIFCGRKPRICPRRRPLVVSLVSVPLGHTYTNIHAFMNACSQADSDDVDGILEL
jgi:hypothetical protein